MDKTGLLEMIARINIKKKGFTNSNETVSWKVGQGVEPLTDSALFPLLQEIVRENKAKPKREVRMAVGLTFGRLMERVFSCSVPCWIG